MSWLLVVVLVALTIVTGGFNWGIILSAGIKLWPASGYKR